MPVERGGPAVRDSSGDTGGGGGVTRTPISPQDLRRRIYARAKAEPSWRFWGLYVHVCKRETLHEAYEMAKRNDGAPGIDGVTFEAIEERGLDGFLDQIRDELATSAIELARLLTRLLPWSNESQGLLALMLLQHSRRATRVDQVGDLVLLEDQDRSLWDDDEIDLAGRTALITGGTSGLGRAALADVRRVSYRSPAHLVVRADHSTGIRTAWMRSGGRHILRGGAGAFRVERVGG